MIQHVTMNALYDEEICREIFCNTNIDIMEVIESCVDCVVEVGATFKRRGVCWDMRKNICEENYL